MRQTEQECEETEVSRKVKRRKEHKGEETGVSIRIEGGETEVSRKAERRK